MATLKVNNETIVITPDNLPAATTSAKGAVKKGVSVPKMPIDPENPYEDDYAPNEIIQSLRESGAIENTKFRLLYSMNVDYSDKETGYPPTDDNVYEANDTATIQFYTEEEKEEEPYWMGHEFIGWATTKNAVTPTYSFADFLDGQTQTVTFTNNDIILYAVWQVKNATITFHFGDYGTGSKPSSITVPSGGRVRLDYSALTPAPTWNGTGTRYCVGWHVVDNEYEGDDYDSYDDINYPIVQHSSTEFALFDDMELYPVFCEQWSVTYTARDTIDTMPSAETAYNGETVSLNFNPNITCNSDPTLVFIGWTDDINETTTPGFTSIGVTSIYMTQNIVLYPVFGDVPSGSITVLNYNTETTFVIVDGDTTTVFSIEPAEEEGVPNSKQFNYELDKTYYTTWTDRTLWEGDYNGTYYPEQELTVINEGYDPSIGAPDESEWYWSVAETTGVMKIDAPVEE